MMRDRYALSGVVSVAALLAAVLLPGGAETVASGHDVCGITTLDATVVVQDDGTLACGPGEDMVVADDLAEADPARATTRSSLAAFLALADFQLVDEESPLRGEFLDVCGTVDRVNPAFRPQESFSTHLLNAHVKAANALASTGSPILGSPYSFAVQLGDAADNQQYNEIQWFLGLLNGDTLIDPDSGADGYEGVQGSDPTGGSAIASPTGESILDLTNEPFWAPGLRTGNAPLPWYSVVGNHDIKVGGTIPDDNPAWRAFARAWVTGALKLGTLSPQHQQRICDDQTLLFDPAFWQTVAANPGTTHLITPDPDRRLLDRADWIQAHIDAGGMPAGHGFAQANRCRDEDGAILARGCYSWDQGALRFIALDTASSEGIQTGNIDPAQFAWLERQLAAASSTYFDANGDPATTENADRLVVVFSHHTTATTDNTSAPPGEQVHTGADLEALLLRFPNVILHANGHTHENRAWPRANDERGTSYWEISTSAVIDWPTQSRSLEIVDNHDGTLSILSVVFDAAVAPDARTIDWDAFDPTDEQQLGDAARAVNEDWLASYGREVAANDPQRDRSAAGDRTDRNVELILAHPLGVTQQGTIVPPAGPPPGPTAPTFDVPTSFPGFGDGLPPGFPGGTGDFSEPPPQLPSTWSGPITQRGLGAPTPGSPPWAARALLLFVSAAAGAMWLVQARVRRWMIGI